MDDSSQPLPTADLLLAHAEFLSSLSSRLVSPGADAEDLAQETWLSALRHPPSDAGALRAWLAKVARNHALQGRRAQRRRAAREEWVSRPEGAPSTDEIVARENARRAVIEALTSLAEPYRSTLLLRFYEDLPPRDVARRTNVPVETARTRIKRGLALLREELDRRMAGGRSAWMSALAPLARVGTPTEGGGGAPSGASGWGPLALPLGVSSLLVLLTVWLASRSGGRGDSPATPLAAASPDERVEARDDPAERSEPAAPDEPREWLSVRLLNEIHGTPLAGLEARYLRADGVGHPEAWVSDERGAAPREFQASLGDRVDVHPTLTTRSARRTVDAEALRAGVLEVRVPAGSSVRGRVLDARGRPAAGARVWAADPQAAYLEDGAPLEPLAAGECDARGEFVLLELPLDFYLHASSDGFTALRGLELRSGEHRTHEAIELQLAPCWRLRGRVVDEDGAPLVGAALSTRTHDLRGHGRAASSSGGSWRNLLRGSFTSGRDGRFELRGLAGIPHNLVATLEGYAASELRVASPDDELLVVLQRAREVDVLVVDERGQALDAEVHLFGESSGPQRREAGAGRARFHVPRAERRAWLKARAPGRAPALARLPLGPGSTRDVLLELGPASVLELRVVDARGEPLSEVGVQARARWSDAGAEGELDSRVAEDFLRVGAAPTNSEGAVRLEDVSPGPLDVTVSAAGFVERTTSVIAGAGLQVVVLEAQPPASFPLHVRVLDALTSRAVSGCVLTLRFASAERRESLVARFDGAAELEAPCEGTWTAYLRAPGYALTVRRWVAGSDPERVEWTMPPERVARVSVRDELGAPVHPARVLLFDDSGAPLSTAISDGYWSNYVETPERGPIVLRGLPAARIRLAIRSPLVEGLEATLVDLTEEREHEVLLSAPCDLSSPRARIEIEWPEHEWGVHPDRSSAAAAPRRGGQTRVELRDRAGVLCGRYRFRVDSDGRAEFLQPWNLITLRFDTEGVCTAAGQQRLEHDTLSSDWGPRWSDDGRRLSLSAPEGGGRIAFSVEGREVLAGDFAPPFEGALRLQPLAR